MQKGLDMLIQKYSLSDDAVISEDGRCAVINNGSYPILPWECERRIIELRNIYKSGRIGEVCTYRIARTTERGADLFDMLYREVGIMCFTLDSCVKSIFAVRSESCMNCIVESESGCIATIELAATLPAGEEDVDKHEMICEIGVACDRVVDTQIPQHSIYLFSKDGAKWRDTDAELYGYAECEVNKIRAAFALAKSEEYREACVAKAKHIEAAVDAARKSLETLQNVKVGC